MNYSGNLKTTIKGTVYTSSFTVPFNKTLDATTESVGVLNSNRLYTYSFNLHLFNVISSYTAFASWKADYYESSGSTLTCLSATPRDFSYNGPGTTVSCSVNGGVNPEVTVNSTMSTTSYCVMYIDCFISQYN